jgi:hypothetical protein
MMAVAVVVVAVKKQDDTITKGLKIVKGPKHYQ